MTTVSILICTRDRQRQLQETLKALTKINVPDWLSLELIVIDNSPSADAAAIVQQADFPRMQVRLVHEPRPGQCYARNAGLAAAKGEIILFTDDDVRPPENWIEEMTTPILSGEADAVAGGVFLAPHLHKSWMKPCHRSWLAGTDDLDPKNPGRMVGANMAFSRRVLEKVPRFDTELGPGALGFYDELLFCMQLTTAGFRIAGRLDAAVEHHPQASRITRKSFLSAAKGLGRSLGYVEYHWNHTEYSVWSFFDALLRLVYWKIRTIPDRLAGIEVPEREIQALMRVFTRRQFLQEKRRPHNYVRHGLVKLSASHA